jgi:hypothetical protein
MPISKRPMSKKADIKKGARQKLKITFLESLKYRVKIKKVTEGAKRQ